ncbi:MAG TPA: restriction endonuclease subunit S [Propionicimonas sp.]|jgi:type I restriction enzyme S subunit
MSIWPAARLAEIGTWFGGGTPSKSRLEFWENGTIPWLSPKDMDSEVLADTQDHITEAAVEGSATRLVPPNSVAVVIRSGILERTIPVALVPFTTTLNQDMKAVAARDGVDPRWIAWGLRAHERELLDTTRKAGTTVASLEYQRFLEFRLPVPPLQDQRRIVDILEDHLSRLDAAHAASESARGRLVALEDSAIRGVLFPASGDANIVRRIVEGERPLLSPGWRWEQLGALAEVVSGITKDTKKQSDPGLVEVPYLRVANVQRAHLDLSRITMIRVRPAVAETLALRRGDVLMNEGGDRDKLARGWVWEDQIPGCIHQNHVHRARPDQTIIEPEWLAWCANTFGARWAQRHGRQSVNLASISRSTLLTMPIPVPPLDVQRRATTSIRTLREDVARMRHEVDSSLVRSSSLRRALLAAAFSGGLTGRSSDLDIAEELMPA